MTSLADLLGMPSDDADDAGRPYPLPEAAIATLKEAAANALAACPFKPGDVVTTRNGYNIKDAGHPCVVIEVMDAPRNFTITDPHAIGSAFWGSKRNVRVLELAGPEYAVAAFWYEHWQLEPYAGEGLAT